MQCNLRFSVDQSRPKCFLIEDLALWDDTTIFRGRCDGIGGTSGAGWANHKGRERRQFVVTGKRKGPSGNSCRSRGCTTDAQSDWRMKKNGSDSCRWFLLWLGLLRQFSIILLLSDDETRKEGAAAVADQSRVFGGWASTGKVERGLDQRRQSPFFCFVFPVSLGRK